MSNPEDERQWAENMRFYSNARFKQLTLWLGGMTLFLAGLAKAPKDQLAPGVKVQAVLAVAAPMFTAVMWVMETRAALYFTANREKAQHLWPSGDPKWRWIGATNALLLLFAGTYAAWFAFGRAVKLHVLWQVVVGAVGILILLFAVMNYYVNLWRHKE